MLNKIEYTKVATTKKDLEEFFSKNKPKAGSKLEEMAKEVETAKADRLKEIVEFTNKCIDQYNKKAEKSESAKKIEEKPVASLKKSSKKSTDKKTADKSEKTKESLYPSSYDTENSIMTKEAWNVDKLEAKEVLLGRYFNIKKMDKTHLYSYKETAIQSTLEAMKKEGSSPFPNNIDLYEVVNSNEEIYILQSIITGSFTSIRKDDVQRAVEEDVMALYTLTIKEEEEEKEEEEKEPAKEESEKEEEKEPAKEESEKEQKKTKKKKATAK